VARTSFPVEVLTPEGKVFEDEVEMVSTRTTTGSIGVLANHAPLMAILEPTELRLYKSDSEIVRFAQGEGYLQVVDNSALVLVEDPSQRTMAGALGAFQGHYATNIPLLSAGTILILLPTLLLFIVFQTRYAVPLEMLGRLVLLNFGVQLLNCFLQGCPSFLRLPCVFARVVKGTVHIAAADQRAENTPSALATASLVCSRRPHRGT